MTNLLSLGSLSTQHKCLDGCPLRSWDRKEERQSGGTAETIGKEDNGREAWMGVTRPRPEHRPRRDLEPERDPKAGKGRQKPR